MSKFSFSQIFAQLTAIAASLNNSDFNSEQRLQAVTDETTKLFEEVDNVVELLPPGFRDVAAAVVDNPLVDGIQATKISPLIARGIAEAAYQASKLLAHFGVHWGPGQLESAAQDPTLPEPSVGDDKTKLLEAQSISVGGIDAN